MSRPSNAAPTVQLTFRVPETWLKDADVLAGQISRPGFEATRTDAFRMAIARGFEEMKQERGREKKR